MNSGWKKGVEVACNSLLQSALENLSSCLSPQLHLSPVDYNPTPWTFLRPSGTGNEARGYAEASTQKDAVAIANEAAVLIWRHSFLFTSRRNM